MKANTQLTADNLSPPAQPAPATVRKTGKSRLGLWLSELPKHKLALNPSIAQAIKAEINSADSTSERLAAFIQQDPALSLSLYRSAQSKMKKKDGDIQSLAHLISLIGLRDIESTLTPIPAPISLIPGQYELYSSSIFSAHLAKALLPIKHGTVGERFFLPTLLFNAPLWLMWQAAPKVMEKIQTSASEQQLDHRTIYKKNLGFKLPQLLKRTPQYLQLPDETLKALAIDINDDPSLWSQILRLKGKKVAIWFEKNKAAKHFFFSKEMGLYLINHYALALYLDWNGKHIRRFENLLCKHLNIEIDELKHSTATAATQIKLPNIFGEHSSPLYRLRGLHRGEDIALVNKQQQKARSGSTDAASTGANDALTAAYDSMLQIAKPDHCVIFRKTEHTDGSLKVFKQSGFGNIDIESLTLQTNMCGLFFKKIMQKPVALVIEPEKIEPLKKQLPRPLLRFWNPVAFSIMSVFFNDKPFAIMLCSDSSWSQARHLQFKTIGKQLNKTLKSCR